MRVSREGRCEPGTELALPRRRLEKIGQDTLNAEDFIHRKNKMLRRMAHQQEALIRARWGSAGQT